MRCGSCKKAGVNSSALMTYAFHGIPKLHPEDKNTKSDISLEILVRTDYEEHHNKMYSYPWNLF